jgi:VanZ family protein
MLMGLIFYLSSLSGLPNFNSYDLAMKKGAHFTVYAILYLLLFRAFYLSNFWTAQAFFSAYLIPGIIAVLYAISDEIHQSFVPLRQPAVKDVLIDIAGIVVMSVIVGKWSVFWTGIFTKSFFCKKKTP